MENKITQPERFYGGGFLYNPQTKSVLLHLRDSNTKINPNQWAFFGGLNEGNETPEMTFMREVKEELGIDISPEEVKPLCNYFNSDRNTHRYVFFIESDKEKSTMHLTEGADFDWIPLAKVLDYDLTEKTKNDIQTFLAKYIS